MQKQMCLVVLLAIGQVMSSSKESSNSNQKKSRYSEVLKPAYKLFEGDIRVPSNFDPVKRNAVADKGLLWPGGNVPYTIGPRLINEKRRQLIEESMRYIEEATKSSNGKKCIKFVPRRNEANYAYVERFTGCYSDLGRIGNGKQKVSLGRQCYTKGTIVHELLHTLGFYHEQSRADRDYYIKVHNDNIIPGAEKNFKRFALGTSIDHLDQPYDFDSIMHYRSNNFAKDPNKPTISPRSKLVKESDLGQRDHLSQIDIIMIRKLYGCDTNEDKTDYTKPCRDKLTNCYLYGERVCNEQKSWAEKNCALTCKVCQLDCENKIDNCHKYDKNVACQGKYLSWAKNNCAKYCGLGDCQYLVTTTPAPVETCEDKLSDCAGYGKETCTSHEPWARERCKLFCGFCPQGQVKTTAIPVTKSAPCVDKIFNCHVYSAGACASSSYIRNNCPKACGVCTDNKGIKKPAMTTTTPTPTTTTAISSDLECYDKETDCAGYGQSVCETHSDWSKVNCRLFCEICKPKVCKDELANCHSYGKYVCGDEYLQWAETNCAKYCRVGNCKHLAESRRIPTTTPTTTTPTTTISECYDKEDDCRGYGQSVCETHRDWSKINCPLYCGICEPKTTTNSNCYDQRDDCMQFEADVCSKYVDWSRDNCARHCDLCS